jgi:broad specificity phosphatase PhoE
MITPMNAPDPRLIVMRHGETEWSKSGQHTGYSDIPLTEVGEAQAKAAGPELAALELRNPLVLSSPRQRAIRTAELAGLSIERTWDDLVEWNYGEYEGLTTPQIREFVPDWTVWTHPCPGGETAAEVQARADGVLSEVMPQLADRDVILFGHGHFSRVLIARWIGLTAVDGVRFGMAASAYSILSFERGIHQVVAHSVCAWQS